MKNNFFTRFLNRPKTLKGYIGKYIIFSGILLALSYIILFQFVFYKGLDKAIEFSMESEARHYERLLNEGKNPELPHSLKINSVWDYHLLPEHQKQFFDDVQINHRELAHRDICIDGSYVDINDVFDNCDTLEPNSVIFIFRYDINQTTPLYLVQEFLISELSQEQETEWDHIMLKLLFISILPTLVLILLLLVLVWKLARPMAELSMWSKKLTITSPDIPKPDLQFSELNDISEQLQDTLITSANSIEHEQDFLRHASHELRTPIAIINNNIELLRQTSNDKNIDNPLQRIDRASKNMQHITETLLWLNRTTSDQDNDIKEVNAAQLIHQVIDQNSYLVRNKEVSITQQLLTNNQHLPATAFRLVLSNLIRNAMQYTQTGSIHIELSKTAFHITNKDHGEKITTSAYNNDDYGYGLGLHLVEKIADKLGWKYEFHDVLEANAHGRSVSLHFDQSNK